MAELETDHTSTTEECISCQQLLEQIDADLREFDKETAAARAKWLMAISVLMVVAVGGVVAWWLLA